MDRVLIIEDDENVTELVRRMCLAADIKPSEFKSVKTLEGGVAASAELPPPDLILMDLTLPPHGERETVKSGVVELSRVAPLVVITGSTDPNIVFLCHAAGAEACLLKHRILAAPCGVEMFSQSVVQATLNWKRQHAPKT
jgi:DNA-binding NarL/FixJ family response regulator